MAWTDADGAQLTGEHGYTLLLSPNPPADALWSITLLTCATPVSTPTQSIAVPSAIASGTRRSAASSPNRQRDHDCSFGLNAACGVSPFRGVFGECSVDSGGGRNGR